MTILTEDEVRAIRDRAEAATAGPWEVDDDDSRTVWGRSGTLVVGSFGEYFGDNEDATFIAAARTDVPALAESHEALWAHASALVPIMTARERQFGEERDKLRARVAEEVREGDYKALLAEERAHHCGKPVRCLPQDRC